MTLNVLTMYMKEKNEAHAAVVCLPLQGSYKIKLTIHIIICLQLYIYIPLQVICIK